MISVISFLTAFRVMLIIQGGVTASLLLLACGVVLALPKIKNDPHVHISRRGLVVLFAGFAFVLIAILDEIVNRISRGESFRIATLALWVGLSLTDVALYLIVRRRYLVI